MPSNLYLFDGTTLVDARSVSSTGYPRTVTFDLNTYSVYVEADTTKTFSIKADFPSNTVSGTTVSTAVTEVTYENPTGSSETQGNLNIAGPYHFLSTIVPKFSKTSSTVTTVKNNNIDTSVLAEVKLGLTSEGGDISATTSLSVYETLLQVLQLLQLQ